MSMHCYIIMLGVFLSSKLSRQIMSFTGVVTDTASSWSPDY